MKRDHQTSYQNSLQYFVHHIHSFPSCIESILFLRHQTIVLMWNFFEFLSPAFSQTARDFWLWINSNRLLWTFKSFWIWTCLIGLVSSIWRVSNSLSRSLILLWAKPKIYLFHFRRAVVVTYKLMCSLWPCIPPLPYEFQAS